MYLFQCDYNMMCHPAVLEKMNSISQLSVVGYGTDDICRKAADKIRCLCGREDIGVHFLSGGTQTNLTIIAAALRPYQAVVAAQTGHISEHETGAIEATGHKVLELPAIDGKITAAQIDALVLKHYTPEGPGPEHSPQPKLVYISMSTELGTLYSLAELKQISEVCKKRGMYLYIDGARLGYALAAKGNDVTLKDMAVLCDAFYIGGTKQGAMFGEAVIITNPALNTDFRYMIKQRGGMLAKGWLMGAQFDALFEDDLYFKISAHANQLADRLRETLVKAGFTLNVVNPTNQVFAVIPDAVLDELGKNFMFTEWTRIDDHHRMVRFCTSWATKVSDVDALCNALMQYAKGE